MELAQGVSTALRYRSEKLSISHYPIVVTSYPFGSPNLEVMP
jgi:hypothetical protein